jgi:cytochrome P450
MLAASFSPRPLSDAGLARYQAAASCTMALADEMIAAHQSSPPTCPRPDLVDDLLAAVAHDASLMSKQDLRIAVLTPYIAGINPVAHTLSCLLYALLTHPQILASVLAEVNDCIDQEGLSLKAVRKMERLRYSIWEALRLYPFAPVLQMTALQAFEFDGCRVKPDTAVVLATTVPHFLEKYYAEPFTFDIDRYRPHRAEHRQPGAFAAYGVGSHICLGAGFAEDQMLLTMAALLHNTSMQLAPDASKPVVGIPSTNNFPVYIS